MTEIILRINKNFFLDWIDCLVCITCVSKEKWEDIRDKVRVIPTLADSPVMNEILDELTKSVSERPVDIAAYRILFGDVNHCGNVDIIAFLEDVIVEAQLEARQDTFECIDDLEGREDCTDTDVYNPVSAEHDEEIYRESPTLTSTTVETLVSCEPLETY